MLDSHPRLASLIANLLLILLHRALEMRDSPIITDPQTRADVLQHGHVVTDHQDTTFEVPESEGQGVHGFDVQVVTRFVEDQDVRVRET